ETRYSALSYCWGDVKPPCLTTAGNHDKQFTKIDWEQVPQTFKEAIIFTRNLGLEYIWIDSMCIIQEGDGQADWNQECTRMFNYYSNAYITLGALLARNCGEGLFSKEALRKQHLFDIMFRGCRSSVFAFRLVDEDWEFLHAHRGWFSRGWSLLRRGWAYQERLVAPRVLFFTKTQLIFDCFSCCTSEGKSFESPLSREDPNLKEQYGALLNGSSEHLTQTWQDIVQSYSGLQLTKPLDKLPAIAAIAQQVFSRQKCNDDSDTEYLCGLRKSHLHVDLLWEPEPFERTISRDREEAKYIAPSWSWAS
ncbi:HET-domain-containing protein, partial [Cryphonectria parasitica EP155]